MNDDDGLTEEIEEMFSDIQEKYHEAIIDDYGYDTATHKVTNKAHKLKQLRDNFTPYEVALRALHVAGFLKHANDFLYDKDKEGNPKQVTWRVMYWRANKLAKKFEDVFGKES